jgi:phosphoribosylformimino-5-aminoimidazole carboxamide ribotide isomerase
VVRLIRGRGEDEIDYGGAPAAAARQWAAKGAECLHVIDLGSALGEGDSVDAILEIAAAAALPIQVGGGIRDEARIERLLAGGVTRVILGTRALEDAEFLRRALARHGPERIVLALDLKDGRVKVSGWTADSSLDLAGGIAYAAEAGARQLLVTAIDRDGTLGGANLELVRSTLALAASRRLLVAAAGGIGALEDIRAVLELRSPALEGVVVGRALYEGKVALESAIELAREYRGEHR